GHLPGPISREPRDAESDQSERAVALSLELAHREPCVSARSSHHDPDSVELVSTLRSQSTNIRPEYFLGQARGLSASDAADLSRAESGELRGIADRDEQVSISVSHPREAKDG